MLYKCLVKPYLIRCPVPLLMDFLLPKAILTAFMPLSFKEVSMSLFERVNCRIEVQDKLDEASHRLNIEGAHYKTKTVELKQVELRCEKLLKELQLLEDQKKDLSTQWPVSICLKKLSEKLLTCKIDILNATEVMDAATKASLEKAEAYIKESFEDLKNFQWDSQCTYNAPDTFVM
ncbi:LOW QUALITY PROTEIN: hypothetical protein Cgig2_023933 [Carnegiea gigantea]|uniref:Uncharacterized protein n=1 Tax=Carnegiea gigantea TaxID=171969 RepID=A0A9Q1K0M4_9CARY|nr:LOW QUALITY PROTEIN: hypothetical protein Cgig2_023933 [Carnegiea gigantea]